MIHLGLLDYFCTLCSCCNTACLPLDIEEAMQRSRNSITVVFDKSGILERVVSDFVRGGGNSKLDNVHSISGRVRLDHVISFSDAIFAFSITFMALSIQIPKLSSDLTQAELINRILHLRPQFEIYVISFLIIGVYWISYHLIFNYIRASHSVLIWVNLAFLGGRSC